MPKPSYQDGDFTLTIIQRKGMPLVEWACVLGSRDPRQRRWQAFRRKWWRERLGPINEWLSESDARACIKAFAKQEGNRK